MIWLDGDDARQRHMWHKFLFKKAYTYYYSWENLIMFINVILSLILQYTISHTLFQKNKRYHILMVVVLDMFMTIIHLLFFIYFPSIVYIFIKFEVNNSKISKINIISNFNKQWGGDLNSKLLVHINVQMSVNKIVRYWYITI